MQEIWKDLPNYEGLYQVSTLGRIRGMSYYRKADKGMRYFPVRILKPFLRKNGYMFINVIKDRKIKQYKVSQLVAMTFLNHNPKTSSLVVDHKDEVKTNDRLDNLQVISVRDNTVKSFKFRKPNKLIGTHKTRCGTYQSRININGKQHYLGTFKTEIEAHDAYMKKLKTINLKSKTK